MSDRYNISDQHGIYFLTFTVVDWVDIFTRADYKHIITEALNYCRRHKGLELFAWVLMSNHMHLIARCHPPYRLSDVIRDYKKFTSKKIIDTICTIPESRREWLLHRFHFWARHTARAEEYKVWQDGHHAVYLEDKIPIAQKVDYIHNNPVKQQIVIEPEDYLFSSAAQYAGSKAVLVPVTIIS